MMNARRGLAAAFLLIGLVLAALASGGGPAFAHAMLKRSEPAPGSAVKAAPAALRLAFSERVESGLSTVELHDASGRRVETGALQSDGDGTVLVVPLTRPLAPGRYKVVWRALSVDTHVTHGEFTFTVAP